MDKIECMDNGSVESLCSKDISSFTEKENGIRKAHNKCSNKLKLKPQIMAMTGYTQLAFSIIVIISCIMRMTHGDREHSHIIDTFCHCATALITR